MKVLTTDRFDRWTRGLGLVALVALVALAWSLFVPGGVFWTAVVAGGLIGSVVGTAVLVRSRRVPSLAQVIASAEAAPVVGAGGRKR
jgi:uncharacterized membrane protein